MGAPAGCAGNARPRHATRCYHLLRARSRLQPTAPERDGAQEAYSGHGTARLSPSLLRLPRSSHQRARSATDGAVGPQLVALHEDSAAASTQAVTIGSRPALPQKTRNRGTPDPRAPMRCHAGGRAAARDGVAMLWAGRGSRSSSRHADARHGGADFLRQASITTPDATRLLLAGEADLGGGDQWEADLGEAMNALNGAAAARMRCGARATSLTDS